MISFEEIKDYLPKYLTPESEKTLFEEVKRFPENIDSRLYTNYLKDENIIFQGDGIEGLLFVVLHTFAWVNLYIVANLASVL